MRFAIVASKFNSEIVDGLIAGARRALVNSGIDWDHVAVFRVPGAFEIPLVAKKAAQSAKYDAVIAIGCLIKGETAHFEYISLQASMGLGLAALETGVPITFGIITVNTDEQAVARSGDNNENKGYEAAMAAIEMVELLRRMA